MEAMNFKKVNDTIIDIITQQSQGIVLWRTPNSVEDYSGGRLPGRK